MATHFSIFAWKISWIEEHGGLQFMGSHRVGHNWVTVHTHTHHSICCCCSAIKSYICYQNNVLEKEMATHSSVLAWRIPGTGEPGGLPSTGSHRVGHDWSVLAAAFSPSPPLIQGMLLLLLSHFSRVQGILSSQFFYKSKTVFKIKVYLKFFLNFKWQPTLVLLPGESHGQRNLVGYSPQGHKESDTTEWLHFHFHFKNFLKSKMPESFLLFLEPNLTDHKLCALTLATFLQSTLPGPVFQILFGRFSSND